MCRHCETTPPWRLIQCQHRELQDNEDVCAATSTSPLFFSLHISFTNANLSSTYGKNPMQPLHDDTATESGPTPVQGTARQQGCSNKYVPPPFFFPSHISFTNVYHRKTPAQPLHDNTPVEAESGPMPVRGTAGQQGHRCRHGNKYAPLFFFLRISHVLTPKSYLQEDLCAAIA
jgi:hypothetical protein